MNMLRVENLDKLNPIAVRIATAIINAKFGPERCKCCRQSLPRDDISDVIGAWANEFGAGGPDIVEIHAAILNVLIVELSRLAVAS